MLNIFFCKGGPLKQICAYRIFEKIILKIPNRKIIDFVLQKINIKFKATFLNDMRRNVNFLVKSKLKKFDNFFIK